MASQNTEASQLDRWIDKGEEIPMCQSPYAGESTFMD